MALNSKLCLSILVGLSIISCKPQGSSTAKSLDNFAKGEGENLTVNRCGVSYYGNLSRLPEMVQIYEDRVIADTADLKNEVLGTLTAVPGVLLETFYNIGGKIQVGKTATTQCANTSIADSEIDFIGSENSIQTCWKQTSPEEAPVILIAGNKDLIRHSLVRLFGYMFTEFFVARLGSENAPTQYKDPEWVEAVESFKAMRSTLANAFLNDLAQVDKPAHKRLSAFSSADTTRFENYVFAEALDSYYCSDDTRYVFQQNYREAYKVFTDKSNPEAPAVQFGDMDDSN